MDLAFGLGGEFAYGDFGIAHEWILFEELFSLGRKHNALSHA